MTFATITIKCGHGKRLTYMLDEEFAEVGEIFVGKVQGLLLGVVELLLTFVAWRSSCVQVVVDFAWASSIFSHLLITTAAAIGKRIA